MQGGGSVRKACGTLEYGTQNVTDQSDWHGFNLFNCNSKPFIFLLLRTLCIFTGKQVGKSLIKNFNIIK